eukprot:scaffold26271_cov40-Cyclotella_meneghiniana.AAC.3
MDQNEMHCPQWSPQRNGLSFMDGEKFSLKSAHFNTKIGCLGVPINAWMGRNSAYDLSISTPRLGVLESPNHNCSTLTSWMRRNSAYDVYHSTPRLGVLESPNRNCSTLTVPMSHCMYTKWKGMVEIGMHCLQWSPLAAFSVMRMRRNSTYDLYISTPRLNVLESPNGNCSTLTSCGWEEIQPMMCTFQHQDWVSWSPQTSWMRRNSAYDLYLSTPRFKIGCLGVPKRHGWGEIQPMICTFQHQDSRSGVLESPNGNSSTLTSWMGRNSAYDVYISTPRLGVLESPNRNCSTLTVPMSHCMHIKW